MNARKIRSMKAVKVLGLLISSMLVATANALLYSQMFMYSHVTVQSHFSQFVQGANHTDVSASITAGGEEVQFANMIGLNGSLVTYIGAVNITNTNATGTINVELKLDSWDGDLNWELRYINITMYDGATQKGAMLELLPGTGDVTTSGPQSLPAGGMWRVQWDVFWWGNATSSETADVTLVLIET